MAAARQHAHRRRIPLSAVPVIEIGHLFPNLAKGQRNDKSGTDIELSTGAQDERKRSASLLPSADANSSLAKRQKSGATRQPAASNTVKTKPTRQFHNVPGPNDVIAPGKGRQPSQKWASLRDFVFDFVTNAIALGGKDSRAKMAELAIYAWVEGRCGDNTVDSDAVYSSILQNDGTGLESLKKMAEAKGVKFWEDGKRIGNTYPLYPIGLIEVNDKIVKWINNCPSRSYVLTNKRKKCAAKALNNFTLFKMVLTEMVLAMNSNTH